MRTLPPIVVAPNGARRTKADHPALPMTVAETVATAVACRAAGAGGLHAHVRDAEGGHALDAGLYRELIAEMAHRAPDMLVQITTEAVGRYLPDEMRALVDAVEAQAVSVALREMVPGDADEGAGGAFFRRAAERGVAVQHILYAPDEVARFVALVERGVIPAEGLSVLFVLGSYDGARASTPDLIPLYRAPLAALAQEPEWMVCAFGAAETGCLAAALEAGGKARVGFENNFLNADGSVARDNAERVREVARFLASHASPNA